MVQDCPPILAESNPGESKLGQWTWSMDLVNGLGQWIRSKIGVRPSAFRRGVGLEQGHSSKVNGGNH